MNDDRLALEARKWAQAHGDDIVAQLAEVGPGRIIDRIVIPRRFEAVCGDGATLFGYRVAAGDVDGPVVEAAPAPALTVDHWPPAQTDERGV